MSSPEPGLIHRRHATLCLAATSRLSPYLAHGCLSARRLYAEVRGFEQRRRRNRSTYWVYHELVMRGAPPSEPPSPRPCTHSRRRVLTRGRLRRADFLYFSGVRWGTALFSRAGPLHATAHAWRPDGAEARALFRHWALGRTGYPFVDAGMRQLRAEGVMPHLLRQMCAAFLVRDLRLDWRWGAEWFETHLLDHTPDANYGNW